MLSRTSESLLGVAAGLILCANSMPSRPNVARTKTIRKRARRELPAMYQNPRAGTWRDPATPSERSITFGAPVLLDANGRWGLHRGGGLWGLVRRAGPFCGSRKSQTSPERGITLDKGEHQRGGVR